MMMEAEGDEQLTQGSLGLKMSRVIDVPPRRRQAKRKR